MGHPQQTAATADPRGMLASRGNAGTFRWDLPDTVATRPDTAGYVDWCKRKQITVEDELLGSFQQNFAGADLKVSVNVAVSEHGRMWAWIEEHRDSTLKRFQVTAVSDNFEFLISTANRLLQAWSTSYAPPGQPWTVNEPALRHCVKSTRYVINARHARRRP